MNSNKYNVRIENGALVFPAESFPLTEVDHVIIDHRAFTCTTAFLIFLLGSILCLIYMPELIILVAGCFFVWLRMEYSRYIELKVKFRNGQVRRMLSGSFGERECLYRLYDDLKEELRIAKSSV